MNLGKSAMVVLAALGGCGGGSDSSDGSVQHDSGNPDAPGIPAPPALGAQLDRMGRPDTRALLIGTYAAAAAQTALRDAYDLASDAATWRTTMLQTNLTIQREIATNLAVFDAFDLGIPQTTIPGAGCNNALKYSGPPSLISYLGAADVFADDQLYVDTREAACNIYFDLEIEHATGSLIHDSCGGRTLTHDVIDVSYSVLAAGAAGLDQASELAPKISDGVGPHADVSDTFPFLGPPN